MSSWTSCAEKAFHLYYRSGILYGQFLIYLEDSWEATSFQKKGQSMNKLGMRNFKRVLYVSILNHDWL